MRNIVIGSGPAGRLASLQLGKLGEDVTLIEKNHIAGTCLNEGCMVICALTDITKFIDANKNGLEIACGENALLISKVKPEGKGVMSAADWYRGLKK